jgi:hypothetical protein
MHVSERASRAAHLAEPSICSPEALRARGSDADTGTGATLRKWSGRSPRRLERMGAAGGVSMIGLGVFLALTGRRS